MILKSINLAVAFLLELCMLAALAYWGFQTGGNLPFKIVLGIGAPLIAIVIWSQFMAPLAKKRLTGWAYLLVKSIIFGVAALGLALAGQSTLAIIFAAVAVLNQILLTIWKQESSSLTSGE
ncbi:MAG: YrdB family protein [Chloroflexota bacterium]